MRETIAVPGGPWNFDVLTAWSIEGREKQSTPSRDVREPRKAVIIRERLTLLGSSSMQGFPATTRCFMVEAREGTLGRDRISEAVRSEGC